MKKFFWAFTPYLAVAVLFFVAIGGGDGLVPASGESWFFPWTWSMDETRSMIVAGLNGLATISAAAFVGLGLLVASTPAVEAKATDFLTKREASKASKAKDEGEVWNGERRGRPDGHKDPPQGAPDNAAVEAYAQGKKATAARKGEKATDAGPQGSTFVESNN